MRIKMRATTGTKRINRRTVAAGMLLCLCATFFSGCLSGQERKDQEKWVKELNKTFEDDQFEYTGAGSGTPFGANSNVAIARSKEFPDEKIIVRNNDGELQTNYNYIRYQKEAEDYLTEYFDGIFECDDYEVEYKPVNAFTPVEDISEREFVEEYVHLNQTRVTLYKEDGSFPSEEEMAEILVSIVKDRDEVCYITIYCCTEETATEDRSKDCVCFYTLVMNKKDTISSISVASNGGKERHNIREQVQLQDTV